MVKHKISSVILYVIVAISLVIMLFFYISPNTVNIEELDKRIEELMSTDIVQQIDAEPVIDSTAADSLATDEEIIAEADSASTDAVIEEEPVLEEEIAVVEEIDLKDHLSGWELMVYKRTDFALGWAYILFAITAIASLLFPMIYLATNLKALVRVLALVAGAAALFLLTYFVFANGDPIKITGYTGTENSDPGVLRMVGTALYTTYILFGIAILSILYSEVVKIFK